MVEKLHTPLPLGAATAAKEQHYGTVLNDIKLVLHGEARAAVTNPHGLQEG